MWPSGRTPVSRDANRHFASSEMVAWFARIGYMAKGSFYLILGLLAMQVAYLESGAVEGARGVFYKISHQPFGRLQLALLGLGFLAYALWRLSDGLTHLKSALGKKSELRKRLFYTVSGTAHVVLAYTAFNIASGSGGGDNSAQEIASRNSGSVWATIVLVIVGLVFLYMGIRQGVSAVILDFRKNMDLDSMPPNMRRWGTRIGRFGYASRGVVFSIVGWFFIQAAIQDNPTLVGGTREALLKLHAQGPGVMGLVALGLVGYGVFCFFKSRYRQMDTI